MSVSRRAGMARRFPVGIKTRLAIAAVIILLTLFNYWSNTAENPVTGEQQRVGSLTYAQEVALGMEARGQMAEQHGGLEPDAAKQDHVDAIAGRLMAGLELYLEEHGGNVPDPYAFEFHLLADDATVNAFALPGGQVFITDALYTQLNTEDELAVVIGHEIGHVLERHSAERLAKANLTQGLASATGVATGDYDAARMAQVVGQLVNQSFGRDHEYESDRWGVRLAAAGGYDPRAVFGVMEVLAAAGGEGPPEFFSTHPKPANRVKYAREVLREEFPGLDLDE